MAGRTSMARAAGERRGDGPGARWAGCCALLALFGGGCCAPDSVSVVASRVDDVCVLEIAYEGSALGVYVTAPDVELPRSNTGFDGTVYFGLDSTSFPDGIASPVRYGDFAKERAVNTRYGRDHSNPYPMPLEAARGPGLSIRSGMPVGPFKVGIVAVAGNTERVIDAFECPAPGESPRQFGDDLPIHLGED